jgi:hypothetical protein
VAHLETSRAQEPYLGTPTLYVSIGEVGGVGGMYGGVYPKGREGEMGGPGVGSDRVTRGREGGLPNHLTRGREGGLPDQR